MAFWNSTNLIWSEGICLYTGRLIELWKCKYYGSSINPEIGLHESNTWSITDRSVVCDYFL